MIKNKFENLIQYRKRCFNVHSYNIQSIRAKFDELKIFVEQIQEKYNFQFSAICVQECQFKDKDKTIINKHKLNNYEMLLQGQPSKPCSTKGGLMVFVNDS